MKNKLVIASLLLAGTAVSVSAQEKEKFYSESWKHNIFISVGAGAQATTNPDTKFGKSVTPLVNVSLGKFINPIWGFRGQVYGWQSKQMTAYPFLALDNRVKRKENYVGVNLDGMMNLTNLFCGYKPGRVFEAMFFVGPSVNFARNYGDWEPGYTTDNGVLQPDGSLLYETQIDPSKTTTANKKIRCLVGASVGLGAKFNINPKWAIDVEARGQVTPSILGAYSSAKTDGYLHLTAGVTHTFGGKKFVSCGPKVDQSAINDELNKYRDDLARAQRDLADAKYALENVEPVVREVVKEVEVAGPRAIFFQINKAVIDDYGLVNLKLAAKTIKANPDKKYKIAGYADKATGNAKWNQKLSDMRAQAVYDALIKEGVSKDQLEILTFGGTDNMFGKNLLNRVVILE